MFGHSSSHMYCVQKRTKTNKLEDRKKAHILQVAYKQAQNTDYIKPVRRHTRLFDGIVLCDVLAKGRAAERSVYYKCASLWNEQPPAERRIDTYEKYKKFLKEKLALKINNLPQV